VSDFAAWRSAATNNLGMNIDSVEDDVLTISWGIYSCTLTCPPENPGEGWYFFAEDEALESWYTGMNDFCGDGTTHLSAKEVLEQMVKSAMKKKHLVGVAERTYRAPIEIKTGPGNNDVVELDVDPKINTSDAATRRLIDDIKGMMIGDTQKQGFEAKPSKTANGLINLYQWDVKLFGFEGPLADDLQKWKKSSGKDYVSLVIKFSSQYPFVPPFVRVLEPRFAFRTGHVTLGGAICMEMLTMSGWRPINSIESIIITVRAQIGSTEGGARLDFSGPSGYNEPEAWEAFRRAAGTHGWDIKGLEPSIFPTF